MSAASRDPWWRPEFDEFSALWLPHVGHETEFWEAVRANPFAAQVAKAHCPDRHRGDGSEQPYSPEARCHPLISEAIDRAKDMQVVPNGVVGSFWYANCGRQILADRNPALPARGRSEDHLRQLTVDQAVAEAGPRAVLELKRRECDYYMAAEVAEYGGSPVATAILYSPCGIGNHEFLVSDRWTRGRIARLVTRAVDIPDCFFCPYFSDSRPVDTFLKVDCGAVLRVFPVCDRCEPELARGDHDLALDWEHAWDDWDKGVGWPDDKFR
ncbi:hypothetical protein [Aldersonia kunmingensis]|uniref:hypothetical protein n=1 Tax=Aldersonia kunmingensis TaxID=408066 RepID=UPI0008350788|nr:hypothetical protein [Aldersonia kunmingensis]